MRSRRPLISVVLALALMLGQWLAATHDGDHGLSASAPHCAVCVYANAAGAGALPVVPVLALEATGDALEIVAAASPLAATVRNHPIRGPPQLLA